MKGPYPLYIACSRTADLSPCVSLNWGFSPLLWYCVSGSDVGELRSHGFDDEAVSSCVHVVTTQPHRSNRRGARH